MNSRSILSTIAYIGLCLGVLVGLLGVERVLDALAAHTDEPSILQVKPLGETLTPQTPLSPANTWNAVGTGLSDWVEAIAVVGSDVYVGGTFLDAGGSSDADRIARWDGASWHAVGTGL